MLWCCSLDNSYKYTFGNQPPNLELPNLEQFRKNEPKCDKSVTDGEFVDGDGSNRSRVTSELSDKDKLIQVPDDARAISRSADDDVVRRWSSETGHRLTVSEQRLLQSETTSVTTFTELPHIHHLTSQVV